MIYKTRDKVCQWLATGQWYSGFLHQQNWPLPYNWIIVKSGKKPNQTAHEPAEYQGWTQVLWKGKPFLLH
jgi:hypothetical protein